MTLDYELPRSRRGSQTVFWIVTTSSKNPDQEVIIGYRASESEAYKYGLEVLRGRNFRVVPIDTINRHEAAAQLKGKRLADTKDLDKAMIKTRHYKGGDSQVP